MAKKRKKQQQQFDPEGKDYDYASAAQHGIKPDETGHWQSRVPETGLLLKGRKHKTWFKTRRGEAKVGCKIVRKEDGRYYSICPGDKKGSPL